MDRQAGLSRGETALIDWSEPKRRRRRALVDFGGASAYWAGGGGGQPKRPVGIARAAGQSGLGWAGLCSGSLTRAG